MSGYEIRTTEPVSITAGDLVKWTKALDGYSPGDGWVLSYAFVCATDQHICTATNNGDGTFLATLSAAETAALIAGVYNWQAFVTSGTERHRVGEGTLEVLPNYAASALSTGLDARSHNKKVLDAIEATIEGRATRAQSSMNIADRSITLLSLEELIKARDHYRLQYAREQRLARLRSGRSPGSTRCRF